MGHLCSVLSKVWDTAQGVVDAAQNVTQNASAAEVNDSRQQSWPI